MNQKNNKNPRLITIFYQNIWDKPVTGLAYLPGYYYEMKQQEKEKGKGKSTCIDFQTDVEPKPDGMDQLVESDKSLISFNYQNLQTANQLYKICNGGLKQ